MSGRMAAPVLVLRPLAITVSLSAAVRRRNRRNYDRVMSDLEYREMDTPWRRDPAEITERLGAWAVKVVGAEASVSEVQAPDGNGMSSETVLFTLQRGSDVAPEHCVARLAPLPSLYPVFPEYDLELQQRAMNVVAAHSDVPAPTTPV